MPDDNIFFNRLLQIFKAEAAEHLGVISDNTLKIEKINNIEESKNLIEGILRAAHSLKGSAHSVSMLDIVSICQALESIFLLLKNDQLGLSTNLFDLIYQSIDIIQLLLSNEKKKVPISALLQKLSDLEEEADFPAIHVRNVSKKEEKIENEKIIEVITENILIPELQITEAAKTETKELIEEAVNPEKKTVNNQTNISNSETLVNINNTSSNVLPTTVRISIKKLDDLLRQAEEMLSIKLVTEQKVKELNTTFEMFEKWEKECSKIYSEIKILVQNTEKTTDHNYSRLLESMSSNSTNTKVLKNRIRNMISSGEQDKNLTAEMIDNLLDNIKIALMLPFSSILEAFPRIIRDISKEQGKDVELVMKGTSIEIDKRILEELKDALMHLIRNSIDHGIETTEIREKRNKNPKGNISINISQVSNNKVEIIISDDGSGIDADHIKNIALKSGIISKEEINALNQQQILSLIFQSGFSTSPIITDISGRGLGLAIAREKVEKLGGNISVDSNKQGTSFKITLPLTLSTFRGLIVRASTSYFVIPLFNVEYTMRIRKKEINTVENKEVIVLNDQVIAFKSLADVLKVPQSNDLDLKNRKTEFIQVVIVTSADKKIAFQVEEILNEQEVMIKGLGKHLSRVNNIAGVTILGTGKIVPLLNIQDLIKTAANHKSTTIVSNKEKDEKKQYSILIAEDSITSRTLLKNILEMAGYKVKTTIDGMDAFAELKESNYDLLISDVEMPRMDGFQLTSKVRAEKKLSHLPVILITSLNEKAHKEKGVDVGANAYIVKSDFNQSNLLDIIPRLL